MIHQKISFFFFLLINYIKNIKYINKYSKINIFKIQFLFHSMPLQQILKKIIQSFQQ